MRDIKFKVYEKKRKKIFDVDFINFRKNTIFAKVEEAWQTMLREEDCELLQYTGLKDKNGTEIYEGDIVKAVSFARWIGIVKYDEEQSAFIFDDFDKEYRGHSTVFMSQFKDGFEILGNIYENPEIMEEQE